MGTPEKEKPVQLKVFVDKKKRKVMFAEAAQDFVEILFSFFTLPLGTIAKLLKKHSDSKDVKVGSLLSLYESLVSLDAKHFSHIWYKVWLVNPTNSSASICQKLKVNLNDMTASSVAGCQGDPVFVKSMANFIITDHLNIEPVMFDTSITLLNSLNIENINLLEERTMYFGLEEFVNLLKWSLLTNNPLTNLVFEGGEPCSPCFTNSASTKSTLISNNPGQTETILKLLVQKSNKKLLCAQVDNLFVELLFSFLTIPLGAVLHLTKDDSSPTGISNLYNSISRLGDGKYLKSEDVKTMLLCPKLAPVYSHATNLLLIFKVNTKAGHFLKEHTTFVVSNDLEVTACPSIATISRCNTLNVPVGDMEVAEVTIGEHEALLLLKASLTSTSTLTDVLNAFRKEPKGKPWT